MSIKNDFYKRVQKDVDMWQSVDRDSQDKIDRLEQEVKDLDEQIRHDMETTGATSDTAAAQLNREYAQAQINGCKTAIATHKPLYDYDRYKTVCGEIRDQYQAAAHEKLAAVRDCLRTAQELLSDVKDLRRDAADCQKALDNACGETGTDIRTFLLRENVSDHIASPTQTAYAEKSLADLLRRLSA